MKIVSFDWDNTLAEGGIVLDIFLYYYSYPEKYKCIITTCRDNIQTRNGDIDAFVCWYSNVEVNYVGELLKAEFLKTIDDLLFHIDNDLEEIEKLNELGINGLAFNPFHEDNRFINAVYLQSEP